MKKKQKLPVVAQRDFLLAISRLYRMGLELGFKDRRDKIPAPNNREAIVDAILISMLDASGPSRLDDWNDRYHKQLQLTGVYDEAGRSTV